jgi:predicted phage gp36 major capsid-like protein
MSGSSETASNNRWKTSAFTQSRKRFQIVRTQSTKRLAFALWTGGEHVTDLHSAVRHNNAVNQKLEQRALALKVGRRQAVPHALAEDVGVGRERDCLRVPLGISQKRLLLLLKG